MMFKLAVALVLLAVVQLAACGLLLGPPWRHMDKLIAWVITTVGAAVLALLAILAASVLGMQAPLWLGVAVLLGMNASFGWMLVLLVRARRRR